MHILTQKKLSQSLIDAKVITTSTSNECFIRLWVELIHDFAVFLLKYLQALSLDKKEHKLLKSISQKLNQPLNYIHPNELHHMLVILIGFIKNYHKNNHWLIKRKMNISSDFIDFSTEINDILNRLENGVGFANTDYLPANSEDISFKQIPYDDNLYSTLKIFHFHLPDKNKDKLFFVQLTDKCANIMFIGKHVDINDYQKHCNILQSLYNEFGNEIKLHNYDWAPKIGLNNTNKYHHITAGSLFTSSTNAPINTFICPPGVKLGPNEIKTLRSIGFSIFTENYSITYSRNNINVKTIEQCNQILFYLQQVIIDPRFNFITINTKNSIFNTILNSIH